MALLAKPARFLLLAVGLGTGMLGLGLAEIGQAQTETDRASQLPVARGGGTVAGTRTYRGGRWSTASMSVANPDDKPAEVLLSFAFEQAPQIVCSRRVSVPPHTERRVVVPLFVPNVEADSSYKIICTVYDERGGAHNIIPDESGSLQRRTSLPASHDTLASVYFTSRDDAADKPHYDALVQARIAMGQSTRTTDFDSTLLPDLALALHNVDHMLIASDVAFEDAATMESVRQWLFDGGRLWIMLDQVSIESVAELLGDTFHLAEIDRVKLDTVNLQPVDKGVSQGAQREYEHPVEFVRITSDDAEVIYSVDGWPAALTQLFGRGRVVFTTLQAEGWLDPRPSRGGERAHAQAVRQALAAGITTPRTPSSYKGPPELKDVASVMFQNSERVPLTSAHWEKYLGQRIGYKIVSRSPVLLILGSFVAALAISSTVLWRRGKPARFGLLAPAFALVATIAVAVLGARAQLAVPPTVAVGQHVDIVPGSSSVNVTGAISLYHLIPSPLELASSNGGWYFPDLPRGNKRLHEMRWTDFDSWYWEDVQLSPGVQSGSYKIPVSLPSPTMIDATFSKNGLEGQVIGGGWNNFEDAVVVLPAMRAIAASFDAQGGFTANTGDVLAPNQYVRADLLNDERQRRQDLIRQMVASTTETGFPRQPTMLFWTEQMLLPVEFEQAARQVSSAVVSIPLDIRRPNSGADVVIPASFLPYRPVAGPTGEGINRAYQVRTGTWSPMSESSDVWLRVQIPRELIPCHVTKVSLHLLITAPSRRLDVAAAQNGQAKILASRNNPAGVLNVTIDDPKLLALDANGGFLVGVLISDATTEDRSDAKWEIDDVQFSAEIHID